MPARDHYHDNVKRALAKDGWAITAEQFFVKYYRRHLWIDIHAESPEQQQNALIEIKGFENLSSPVEYLESVIGQYVLYQTVLEDLDTALPLFLAVPVNAYRGFLNEPIVQAVFRKIEAKLLVFDPETEEVMEWKR